MIPCLLTFDVEEWFQVENLRPLFPPERWDALPRRVEIGARQILRLLAAHRIRATFFVLGWVAERAPDLVREIAAAGHEIACHGYGHVLPTQQTVLEFRDDIVRGRKILEDICGMDVVGYRAPSFAMDAPRFAILKECGFRYDSSVHPFDLHDRYRRIDDLGESVMPDVYHRAGLVELALPVERVGPVPLPVSGGGYFRLYPGSLFRHLVRRSIARRGQYIFYLHSWEFDPAQPRVRGTGVVRAFRHYNGLSNTIPRMEGLVGMLEALGARFLTARERVNEVSC